jgi:hypothetical protein
MFLTVLAVLPCVLGGPSGYLSVINATPYNLSLTYTHSYQMDWKLRDIIVSGSSINQYIKYRKNQYDAAEATYTLVGAPEPMSFTIQARKKPKRLEVRFDDALSAINNPNGSLIDLRWVRDGAVPFVLAGLGTPSSLFVSTNPLTAWMQATLPTIGHLSLSEVCMPGSHNAGMSEVSHAHGGRAHNSLPQSVNVFEQLRNGARYFDIRPIRYKGQFRTDILERHSMEL